MPDRKELKSIFGIMNLNTRADGLKKQVIARLEAELPRNLFYHSVEHTQDVMDASIRIARAEGCTDSDIHLIHTAALFHDTGYIISLQEHEKNSCTIAREILPSSGWPEPDIEKICELIMATLIPQTPLDRLGEILCDADLDYLGRGDYFPKADLLYREFLALGRVKNEEEWKLVQVNFLQAHRYFTKYCKRQRQPKKEEHLKTIKAGTIHR